MGEPGRGEQEGVRIWVWNVNGLRGKVDDMERILEVEVREGRQEPDIICCTEAWVGKGNKYRVQLDEYTLVALEQPWKVKQGAGVVVLLRDESEVTLVPVGREEALHVGYFKVYSACGAMLLVVTHGPLIGDGELIESWCERVQIQAKKWGGDMDVVLAGDFNAADDRNGGIEGPLQRKDGWVWGVLDRWGVRDSWDKGEDGQWFSYVSPATGSRSRIDVIACMGSHTPFSEVDHGELTLGDGHVPIKALGQPASTCRNRPSQAKLGEDDSVWFRDVKGKERGEAMGDMKEIVRGQEGRLFGLQGLEFMV